MIEIKSEDARSKMPKIAVVGIGGGGENAVSRMRKSDKNSYVTYFAVNTDLQALESVEADERIQIGRKLTDGMGAGADPSIGEAAAKESEEDIEKALKEFNMVILTCGMGGGTGTGAISHIAKICKSNKSLTVAVVTLPFEFEGTPRMDAARAGLSKLRESVDTLIVIYNDKLLEISDKGMELESAFVFADTILKFTVEGITNIVFNTGTINLDFNDLRTTLKDKGTGHLGIGICESGTPILEAVKQAVNSPLLDTSVAGATNIIVNVSGKVNIMELNQAMRYLKEITGDGVNIIWGTVQDESRSADETVVTLIATGMGEPAKKKTETRPIMVEIPAKIKQPGERPIQSGVHMLQEPFPS